MTSSINQLKSLIRGCLCSASYTCMYMCHSKKGVNACPFKLQRGKGEKSSNGISEAWK